MRQSCSRLRMRAVIAAFLAIVTSSCSGVTYATETATKSRATTPPPENTLSVKLEKRYAALKSWRSAFTQTSFVEALGRNLTRTGKITVARPAKLRIDYQSEPAKLYLSNGEKLWVYQPQTATAEEFHNPERVLSREAMSFLGGLTDLHRIFDVLPDLAEPQGDLKIKDTGLKKVSLIPKDAESPVLRLLLGVDEDTLTLREALLFNVSGNVTHYEFSSIEFDKPVAETEFILPKNGNIKVTVHKEVAEGT